MKNIKPCFFLFVLVFFILFTAQSQSCFDIGSTKAQVRAVMGTPTSVNNFFWSYGLSTIDFKNNVVVGYSNAEKNLKICNQDLIDISEDEPQGFKDDPDFDKKNFSDISTLEANLIDELIKKENGGQSKGLKSAYDDPAEYARKNFLDKPLSSPKAAVQKNKPNPLLKTAEPTEAMKYLNITSILFIFLCLLTLFILPKLISKYFIV